MPQTYPNQPVNNIINPMPAIIPMQTNNLIMPNASRGIDLDSMISQS
jgi:hypothetical protein